MAARKKVKARKGASPLDSMPGTMAAGLSPQESALAKFAYRDALADPLRSYHSDAMDLTVYWRSDTMAQKDYYLADLSEQKMVGFCKCLVAKALNADGTKMFAAPNSLEILMNSDKCDEIIDIVAEMLGGDDDDEGNGEATDPVAEAGND